MNKLGMLLKDRRELLKRQYGAHYDQGEVAKRVGLSQGALSQLENGIKVGIPDPPVTNALARELQLPMSQIVEAAGYELSDCVDYASRLNLDALHRQHSPVKSLKLK